MPKQRGLTILGPFPEGDLVVEAMVGREELGTPFEITLTLVGTSPDLDIASFVGDAMTLVVELPDDKVRHFNGFVTRMVLMDTFGRFARYQVTLRPWFFLLSSRTNSRIFQHKSVPAIAKAVFEEHGFSDFELALSESYPEREFVVQYRESDFAFVSRLLEHVGIHYYFKHEEHRHVMVLADSMSAHAPAPGYQEVPFHPEGSDSPSSPESLNRWQVLHQWRPGTFVSRDFDFKVPRANLTAKRQAQARHKRGELEVFDYPGGFSTLGEGETRVRARLEALQADVELVRASGDVRGVGAGNLFTLTGYPSSTQNKEYLVISASYDAANNPHESGAEGGGHFDFSFAAVDNAVSFRLPPTTPMPRVEGVQTAIVVGQSGEEIWTDKYGRVKVQFHWDREGKNGENSSCWVRVAQVWAGAGFGAMHIPRVGQEVVVDFLEGDPDRPIITGRVYNGDNMPPYDLPANKTQSGIKSRSSKGGGPSNFNEIRFEDKKGQEELHMQAEKDHTTTVKHDQSTTVGADRSVSVGSNDSLSVGANRSETVGANETITVGANRTKTVSGAESVSIGSTSSEVIAAARSVAIGGAYQISVGAVMNETVGGAKMEEVGGLKSVNVGAASSENVGGSKSISAGGAVSVSAGKAVAITAGTDLAAKAAKTIVIEAGDELTLKCGSATIVLKKSGDVSINGQKIKVVASADLVLKGSKVGQN